MKRLLRLVALLAVLVTTSCALLGPQFETTFDRKVADFALALGTFYCNHLQHPIMATIEREGVVYATVYDFRGAQAHGINANGTVKQGAKGLF